MNILEYVCIGAKLCLPRKTLLVRKNYKIYENKVGQKSPSFFVGVNYYNDA